MNEINEYIYKVRKKQHKFFVLAAIGWGLFLIIFNCILVLGAIMEGFDFRVGMLFVLHNVFIPRELKRVIKDIYFFNTNQGFYFDSSINVLTQEELEVATEAVKKIKECERGRTNMVITSEHLLVIGFKSEVIPLTDIQNVKFVCSGHGIIQIHITINEEIKTYYCHSGRISKEVMNELIKYENKIYSKYRSKNNKSSR